MPIVAKDPYANRHSSKYRDGVNAASDDQFLVTPSDTDELEYVTRAIRITGSGTLKVVNAAGRTLTFPDGALAAGIAHSIRVRKVFATGTTATGIMGEI